MSSQSLSETTYSLPPPPQRQHITSTIIPKHLKSHRMNNSLSPTPLPFVRLNPLLHRPRRTHPLIWCSAIICFVFCLLIILFGILTLIIFLVIKPKYPAFDVPNANLNAIYFDSPENFNGDFTLLANFSNPNRKINIRYEYLDVELYFVDRLIATQGLEPFSQRPGEARLEMIHLISSLVYLPPNPATELQSQVQSNRVKYIIRVQAKVGVAQFSYWLHARCQLEMTSPPRGVLLARNCSTKR